MVDWRKIRAGLVAAAGIYLIYTAYSLFQERRTDTAMPLWLNCVFSAFFVLAAIAVFVYAYRIWKKAKEEDKAYEERMILEESLNEASQSSPDTRPAGATAEEEAKAE